ncbi:MAG TPA: hypothetical protein VL201_05775 [Patescibacteria group bacterium]|jgi:hypothetical protein|nr:hypothetical protein [Patescibacteria group bacterium]
MIAKITLSLLLLFGNEHMYGMFSLANQILKNPTNLNLTVRQACLSKESFNKKNQIGSYKILNTELAAKLQEQYKKMVTEIGLPPQKYSWKDIKKYNILDENFSKDLKAFVVCNPRNFIAMSFFSAITAETIWVWDTPIIPCLSGWILFSLYYAQKLSFTTARESITTASVQLADVSHINNLFSMTTYVFFAGIRLIEFQHSITQLETAIHIFLMWNFYKNITTSSKIQSHEKVLCAEKTTKNSRKSSKK